MTDSGRDRGAGEGERWRDNWGLGEESHREMRE